METERQQSVVSSLPILAMLAIIGGAYYGSRLPLKSSRPESPLGLEHFVPVKDKIDARLWEDPLKVVMDHEKTMHRNDQTTDKDPRWQCTSDHCVNQVTKQITAVEKVGTEQETSGTHVLLVIVRDGNFAEDHERRLRNRYAVLTALYASGLTNENPKSIQYFRLMWTEEDELDSCIKENTIPPIVPAGYTKSRTIIVPFEWLKPVRIYQQSENQKSHDRVVVVWFPESAFSHRPLVRLSQVFDALGHVHGNNSKIDIIGPSYSDTLLVMLKEIAQLCSKDDRNQGHGLEYVRSRLCGHTIFSPWSTASPVLLMREANMKAAAPCESISAMYGELAAKFLPLGINFLRMIGSDDLLAMELIKELYRRGVDVRSEFDMDNPSEVAMISEWDTFYGRTFPLIFAAMRMSFTDDPYGEPDWGKYTTTLNKIAGDDNISLFKNLRVTSYIRGVDGKLPPSRDTGEVKTDPATESESKWTYTKSLELPTGMSQLDYVRRLALMVSNECTQNKLKAIGVVGSDVYDKLILCHALREQFGDVILFMTDLDTRFTHHEQFKWTRNVIVASNYGLKLNDRYQYGVYQRDQGSVPMFRDNYQTALFFTCRAALGLQVSEDGTLFRNLCQEQLTEFLKYPRLFEIGRDCAVDLSTGDAVIHPPTWIFPGWICITMTLCLILAAVIFCFLLLTQIDPNARAIASGLLRRLFGKARSKDVKNHRLTLEIITAVSVSAVVIFAAAVALDHYYFNNEPFSLVTGISIWPGVSLRLIATILSIFFLTKSMNDLRNSNDILQNKFCLSNFKKKEDEKPKIIFGQWRKKHWVSDSLNRQTVQVLPPQGLAKAVNCIKYWPRYCSRISFQKFKTKQNRVNARHLWYAYLMRGTDCNRLHRLTAMSLAYFAIAIALMILFGPPRTPYRGNIAWSIDKLLLISSVISMIFLMFFVVDATKLSINFIGNLKKPHTFWPESLISSFKNNDTELSISQNTKGTKSAKNPLDCVSTKDLAEWLDVKFIALHTEAVGKLIYYPFIVLLIMFVARNRYFDNWDFPKSLMTIFLLNSTLALCCGFMLRREAENTRRVALNRLQEELVKSAGTGLDHRTKQLGAMIQEIKSIQEGAFSPFTANPVLHAILIPSGGMSLLTLLKFIPLS